MQTLGIFAKHPVPGQVKTRLIEEFGADRAAKLYAAFLADLADKFSATAGRRVIGFAPCPAENEPRAAETYFARLSQARYQLWRQPAGDLGMRMAAFFAEHAARDGDSAVLIGSDSPTLPASFVNAAFDQLAKKDVVVGPAFDGGYYLIGMRNPPLAIFDGIAWSRAGVLAQTVKAVRGQRGTLAVLPPWSDTDTWDDLLFLQGHLAALEAAGVAIDCPRTAQMLRLDTLTAADAL